MLWAIAATVLAGSATIVGGLLALHPGMRRRGPLATGLAFAAGIMIVLSVVEILPLTLATLRDSAVSGPGWWTTAALVVGAGLVFLIDALLPHSINPADIAGEEDQQPVSDLLANRRLLRSGLLVALIVGAHNMPEGLMTFLATLESPQLGASLVVAIAIHNIPEGMAVAAPIYAATGSRRRALVWASISGLSEPVGAVVGYFVLQAVLPDELLVLTLALVAGMMIALSFRELLPAARRYQTHRLQSLAGFAAGGFVIWVSLQIG
jgi:ZIP family zinc transporter